MNKNREESRKQREAEKIDPVAHDKEYLITKKEEQLLDTNSKLCRQISYQYQFRKRTFKSDQLIEGAVLENIQKQIFAAVTNQKAIEKHLLKLQVNSINVEEVKLKLEEECLVCEGQLLASQLRKAIERNLSQIHCTFCGRVIKQPCLQIIIGKKVTRNLKKEENSVK